MRAVRRWAIGFVTASIAAVIACSGGGGGDSPTSPTPPPTGGGGGTASDSATITISSSGVASPSTVTIRQGGRVTFTNNDSRAHDMSSDPHPTHEDCREMEQVGFVAAGQSRTSGTFNTVRTCGFHDHNLPADTGLQGRITIVPQ